MTTRLALPPALLLGSTLSLLAACTPPPVDAPVATFDPTGGFFDTPFPTDPRRSPDAGPDWTPFPNPTALTLLDNFLALASERQGVGFNGPIWVRFNEPIDPTRLPTPAQTLHPLSYIQLVDITPESPGFLERVPVQTRWMPEEGAYLPGNLLAISPVPGFPLRPRTTYALLVLTDLAAPADRFLDAWDGDGPRAWVSALDTIDAVLPALDLHPRDVAVAATLTTDDPLGEMDRMVRAIRQRMTLSKLDPKVTFVADRDTYQVYRSKYANPLWMSGAKPWANEGGRFVYREDGLPEVQEWESMRVSVVLPTDAPPPPPEGLPILIYLHGTGGDWRSFARSTSPFEVGRWAAADGFVGLGIDLPLHGPRGTDNTQIELHSFNVLQPDSALHIHRQGALDLIALLETLRRDPPTFELPDGSTVPTRGDQIVVVGHSQGGIAAAIALPWIDDRARSVVLSGAGGLLAITAVERDSDFDFPTLIRTLLGFDAGEALTEAHPVLGLIQHLVEPTDPINYAPAWLHENRGTARAPTPVLHVGGVRDEQTPSRTSEALAAAARLPFSGDRHTAAPGAVLRGFDSTELPQQAHVPGFDGRPVTAGFAQFFSGNHFVVFRDPKARDMVRRFLLTSLDGDPVIDDAPLPLAD